MLGTIAGFLARRTDFFTGGKEGQWQSVSFTISFYILLIVIVLTFIFLHADIIHCF